MADKPHLLIVDDDPLIGEGLAFVLGDDFAIQLCQTRLEAMTLLKNDRFRPTLALIDLGLPPLPDLPTEGFKLVSDLLTWSSKIRILILTGQNEQSNARRARALGAVALVPKPCEPAYLKRQLWATLKAGAAAQDEEPQPFQLIGSSAPIHKLRSQIDLYASSTFPALIEGESGGGKERVATALHQLSPRAHLPFLALNCAAISASLVEPILFGHAKGAFTGATGAKVGYFEDVGEGTLLLDEIGELPLELQPKLLRVLENGEFQRVGETQARQSKARIIAATNRDLRAEVKAGRFRADLYHRLSVFTLTVPPLRDLGEDKLRLLEHYRQQYMEQQEVEPFQLDAQARDAWLTYPFPGNVRELKNIVIRLIAKHAGQNVGVADLTQEFDLSTTKNSIDDQREIRHEIENNPTFTLDAALATHELKYIEAAIDLAQGNMSQAARILGLSRTTLYSRLEALRPNDQRES